MLYQGYDVGSKSVKVVFGQSPQSYEILKMDHFSDPLSAIDKIKKKINDETKQTFITLTGRYRNSVNFKQKRYVSTVWTKPLICYVNKHYENQIRYIADIGAVGLSLLELKNGNFHRFITNSICASGTGSFLDQQMIRMGIKQDMVDKIGVTNRVPDIASRCAVFAKSDLIHKQQEGYKIEELWNGLVKGMAESCFNSLLRGNSINGKILLLGGLVKNELFLHYFLKHIDKDCIFIPENPDTFIALSCYDFSFSSFNDSHKETLDCKLDNINNKKKTSYEKPLYPEKKKEKDLEYDDFGNEKVVYIDFCKYNKISHNSQKSENSDSINNLNHKKTKILIKVALGIDIGSTSTKAVLIDWMKGDIILSLYRKTQGNPVTAYQNILKGINSFSQSEGIYFEVKGMGTTGSGRKIVGAFAGADSCINEITAHLKGGLTEDKTIKTIFEIGGQDSKYISLKDGWMQDANMNYVCAAGTGSFLEEQALNLNFKLDQFEEMCYGVPAPKTNDRCTVFMEQDSKKLLSDGFSKSEVISSLLYSVCRNYLHRVVQNRPVEEPILFLGATARNKALVEAFKNVLGKEIKTSEISHLTGAVGVAEIVRQDMLKKSSTFKTNFKGFDQDKIIVDFKERKCDDCPNNCRIIYFESESGIVAWGFQCGKEGLENFQRTKDSSTIDKSPYINKNYFSLINIFNQSSFTPSRNTDYSKSIVLPPTLTSKTHDNLWQIFFHELGFNVIQPDISDEEVISNAISYSPNEICYPLKLAIGSVITTIKKTSSKIFLPYLISDFDNPTTTNSFFCPLSQSIPALIKSICDYNNLDSTNLITPSVDLSEHNSKNILSLYDYIKTFSNISKDNLASAFNKSVSAFLETEKKKLKMYKSEFDTLVDHHQSMEKTKPVFIILGRNYNLYDGKLNQGLIKEIKGFGFTVIPIDLAAVDRINIDRAFRNIYWTYGQKLIVTAEELTKYPFIHPILLTNFNCGPDSFLLTIIEEIWKEKPHLILELDEHSGNAGYLTRIEAFLDRVKNFHSQNSKMNVVDDSNFKHFSKKFNNFYQKKVNFKQTELLIPPMNPLGTKLLSSAFQRYGYKSVPLNKENTATYQLGKSLLRGSECLPAGSTLGAILDYYKNNKESTDPNIRQLNFFMPCASGPCRFGQYGFLQKLVLERNNINTEVLSVNSENNYAGFPLGLRIQLFKSIILTDLLLKLGNSLRPYEKHSGDIDRIINRSFKELINAIIHKKSILENLKSLNQSFRNLDLDPNGKKNLIGIVGEIYVRSSPFSNNRLIDKIEKNNCEAWLTPFMEWFHYTTYLKEINSGSFLKKLKDTLSKKVTEQIEKQYFDLFSDILKHRIEPDIAKIMRKAAPYISSSVRGEAVLTIGRTICFIEDGAKMIINTSPFSCMPGNISSIILKNISLKYSIPIISIYYDGYSDFDTRLEHYLLNI